MQTTLAGITLFYAVEPTEASAEGDLRVEVLDAGHLDMNTDRLDMDFADARCRLCDCTEDHGCPGGCCWVTDPAGGDLCSECLEAAYHALQRHMEGSSTPEDVDLLHRFTETGPHRDPPLATVRIEPTAA